MSGRLFPRFMSHRLQDDAEQPASEEEDMLMEDGCVLRDNHGAAQAEPLMDSSPVPHTAVSLAVKQRVLSHRYHDNRLTGISCRLSGRKQRGHRGQSSAGDSAGVRITPENPHNQ